MPRRGLAAARRLARRGLDRQMLWTTSRRARALRAPVVVCWDLDNTLVDTGALLHAGRTLEEAVAAAEPMAGMLEFVAAIRSELPEAGHLVLSVRSRGMRPATLAWLDRHRAGFAPEAVCLAPSPASKAAVWSQLAARGRLLVVDDLSHGHEGDAPRRYEDVIERACSIADVYLGLDEIAAVGADPAAARALAADVAARLR